MTRKEAITEFMQKVKKAYADDQKDKDIRASGKSADTMRITVTKSGGKLYGLAYIYYQKYGRRPGQMPPIDDIIQWIRDKRTFNVDEKGIKGLAFAIAKTIAKKGTQIFQRVKPALNIDDKMPEYRKELVVDLGKTEADKIRKKLRNIPQA